TLNLFERERYARAVDNLATYEKESGVIAQGDSIVSLLMVRCIDESVKVGLESESGDEHEITYLALDKIRRAAPEGALEPLVELVENVEAAGAESFRDNPRVRQVRATLHYFLQYLLFRLFAQDELDRREPRSNLQKLWETYNCSQTSTYDEVHPF